MASDIQCHFCEGKIRTNNWWDKCPRCSRPAAQTPAKTVTTLAIVYRNDKYGFDKVANGPGLNCYAYIQVPEPFQHLGLDFPIEETLDCEC